MSILDLVKNASIKQQVLKEHPVQGLCIEEKTTYLNGIALMANVDGEIADSEKEYIKTLTNSFKLDKSAFDDCIDFAMNPDGETVELLIQQLQGNDYSYTFLLDSLMLINSDKKQDEDENKLFHQYAEMLNISALNLSYLTQLFYSIKDNEFGDFYAYSMVHDANHDGLNLDIHYYKYLLIHYGYDDIEWTMQASIDLKEMKEGVQ